MSLKDVSSCQENGKAALYLVKVSNDLIQQSQALHSHVITIQLNVEIIEVWNGCKQDTYLCVGLIVQVLKENVKKSV